MHLFFGEFIILVQCLVIKRYFRKEEYLISWESSWNLSKFCEALFFREGFKKKKIYYGKFHTRGGQGGSFSISNFFYFFCSKWSKNHF